MLLKELRLEDAVMFARWVFFPVLNMGLTNITITCGCYPTLKRKFKETKYIKSLIVNKIPLNTITLIQIGSFTRILMFLGESILGK